MPRHSLAREHVRGALVLARGARRLVRDRVAVARPLRMEVVPPGDAGEALSPRHAPHIVSLAGLEEGTDIELRAGLEVGELLGLGAELAQRVTGLDACLGEVPRQRLADARRAALAERHLHGGVAVALGRLD